MKPLGLKELDTKTVSFLVFDEELPEYVGRVFRIDWRDGHQYRQWVELPEMREGFIFPFAQDDRYPNLQITTINAAKEYEVRYYEVERGRLGWWLAQADGLFPMVTEPQGGRPQMRGLEMLTTRQRRIKRSTRI